MAEYFGDKHNIAVQKAIRARVETFTKQPLLANGGRIMNILDPETYGWNNVRIDAERDGFISLTMVDRDKTLARLVKEFGSDIAFPYWEVFTAPSSKVIPTCQKIVEAYALPNGWTLSSKTHPDEKTIEQSQHLNQATGVAPTPAYYQRGDYLPTVLTCLRDAQNTLVACASATMRYHPDGPLAGWLFAGAVSVNPDHRKKGLGVSVNAKLLCDSHKAFKWNNVLEQAKADNSASIGMITRCGLHQNPNISTIVISLSGRSLTR